MTYRSLLVFLDHGPLCRVRTEVATRLAKTLDCHLVGLAPTGVIDVPGAAESAAQLAEFAALAWDTLRDQAKETAQRFRDACHAAGIKSFESKAQDKPALASMAGLS